MAAFFQRCGMLAAILAQPAVGQSPNAFTKSAGQLEATVTLQTNRSWHLGGFCFGQAGEDTTKAAEVRVHVNWGGQQPLGKTPVVLAAFDDSDGHWGAVRSTWNETSCEEKLAKANMARQLGETHSHSNFFFRVNVHQDDVRDWHFALVTCGGVEQAPLTIKLAATDGALNMFEAGTHFFTSSCPALEADASWWAAASDEAGFWLLLAGLALVGCSGVLAVLLCRHFRAKALQRHFAKTATAGGAEPVIGRPCQGAIQDKVVDGQLQLDNASAQPDKPANALNNV
mmetsp:Transcript_3962/g.9194  ORF Transcript_3962/g.9194 Transcript_3962/m.9194 type:complete len:285 (-) Transcript_3962:226-1080(-)